MMNGTGFFKGFYAAGVYWNNPDGTIYPEGVYQYKEENGEMGRSNSSTKLKK